MLFCETYISCYMRFMCHKIAFNIPRALWFFSLTYICHVCFVNTRYTTFSLYKQISSLRSAFFFFILLVMYIFCRKPGGFVFFHILDTAAPVGSKYQMDVHVHCSLSVGEQQKGRSHTNKGIQVKLLTFSISLLKFKVRTNRCEC